VGADRTAAPLQATAVPVSGAQARAGPEGSLRHLVRAAHRHSVGVPAHRYVEFTDTQTKVLENHLEKIRATADWIETAAATGQVDLDEQLAQLLRGQ
jgi:uncharacterized protein DUF6192